MWNEEEDGSIRKIIFGSTDDSYHVPIINDGPFNGYIHNNACLV